MSILTEEIDNEEIVGFDCEREVFNDSFSSDCDEIICRLGNLKCTDCE